MWTVSPPVQCKGGNERKLKPSRDSDNGLHNAKRTKESEEAVLTICAAYKLPASSLPSRFFVEPSRILG